MAEPNTEELLERIRNLEKLVTTQPQQVDGPEYSFPTKNGGISQYEHQLISRAAGTGVFTQHNDTTAQSSYRLVGMPGGDSETNATNRMRLLTSSSSGKSEAVIEGFFHVMTENMDIDFPPVTKTTTYYLCLTYDPREWDAPEGPIRVRRYSDTIPTENGRKSIVLYSVTRRPNELLSNAVVSRQNPWLGHVINVWHYDHLPEPTSVEYGTMAVVINPGGNPEMYTNRGVWGWRKFTNTGEWQNLNLIGAWGHYASHSAQYRVADSGLEFRGRVQNNGVANINTRFAVLPSDVRPPRSFQQRVTMNPASSEGLLAIGAEGDIRLLWTNSSNLNWIFLDGITVPLD